MCLFEDALRCELERIAIDTESTETLNSESNELRLSSVKVLRSVTLSPRWSLANHLINTSLQCVFDTQMFSYAYRILSVIKTRMCNSESLKTSSITKKIFYEISPRFNLKYPKIFFVSAHFPFKHTCEFVLLF